MQETNDTTLYSPFPIEAGVWVKISEAPQPCGYFLINKQIYALEPEYSYDEDFSIRDSLIEYVKHYKPVNDVDIPSFEVCIAGDGYSRYAKDLYHVYYPERNEEIEFMDRRFHPKEYGQNLIIHGADPATFKYIGRGYAVDKNNMYRDGEKIEWSDSLISLFFQRHKAGLSVD